MGLRDAVEVVESLDDQVVRLIAEAGLTRPGNRFLARARAIDGVAPDAALAVARQWREMTRAFMFTTIAGLGLMARDFEAADDPGREVLGAFRTAFTVIGDDLANLAPEFAGTAPAGVSGIHYLWWADSIVTPLEEVAGDVPPRMPAAVAELVAEMRRMSGERLGAAVQLRVVEAIALDIAVAFRRMYAKVLVDGRQVFPTPASLAWIDAHIRAETGHAASVSDGETGMTAVAATEAERAEFLRLATGYAEAWARALDEFAGQLTER